jgi:hypothetical protein
LSLLLISCNDYKIHCLSWHQLRDVMLLDQSVDMTAFCNFKNRAPRSIVSQYEIRITAYSLKLCWVDGDYLALVPF